MILHASHDDRRFRIEKTDAGYYLFVFERERCTHDYLQDTLVLAKECARERFGVPENGWSEAPPVDSNPLGDWDTLHNAAQRGDVVAVKAFLAKGSDIYAFDDISFTPLHHAAKEGHLELVTVLLESGADVNANEEAQIGNTPLGEIAGYCSLEMARRLIAAGADPTIRGWMQLSALDRAQERKKPEGRKVYELLIAAAKRFKRSN